MKNLSDKWIFVGIGALTILVLIISALTLSSGEKIVEVPKEGLVKENNYTLGSKDAKVAIVEFSDFQCPACGSAHPIIKRITQEYGDKILFVYRHFPLTNIRKQAELAAYAAEAAGKQGKFWEMYDLLFNNQEDWAGKSDAKDIFLDYAKELKLTLEQFEADLDLAEIKDKVEAQLSMGQAANVNATPTFYLNGTKIATNPKYEEFKDLLTLELTTPSPEVRVETQGEEQSPNGSSAQ